MKSIFLLIVNLSQISDREIRFNMSNKRNMKILHAEQNFSVRLFRVSTLVEKRKIEEKGKKFNMKDINEAIKVKRKPHSVLFFKAMQTNNKQRKSCSPSWRRSIRSWLSGLSTRINTEKQQKPRTADEQQMWAHRRDYFLTLLSEFHHHQRSCSVFGLNGTQKATL